MFTPKKPFETPSCAIAEIQNINVYSVSGKERNGWDTYDYGFDTDSE